MTAPEMRERARVLAEMVLPYVAVWLTAWMVFDAGMRLAQRGWR